MSQQVTLTMASIGGPVGAMPPNTANHANQDHSDYVKRLNTYIYDYFVRNQHYDCARSMLSESLPLELHSKSSQANGVDDMDTDTKDRPKDLPRAELPAGSGDFLEDWWTQFWDVFNSRRTGSGKTPILSYISQQRQMQKARSGMMGNDAAARANLNMMNGGGQGGPDNLKKAAMMNNGQMHPQMQAMARARAQAQAQQQQQQQILQAGQMERQGSQMDNRSGSPGSGGAPSPKRARTDGNGQMLRGAPGQAPGGHMQNQSLESYNAQIQQSMKSAMNQAQANSNMIKGMPSNAAQAAALQAQAQGSPMPQAGIDMLELANANGLRPGMIPQNGINGGGPGQLNGGSHALQDYQMQLMLLEQQNKRRLLMAKGEQDSMSGNNGMPTPNGQFPHSMSPSGRGNPSPNPNDMARGTPNMLNGGPSPNNLAGRGSPGPNFDPNAMRAQLMVGPNGQMIPRSNPMQANQIEMIRASQMMQGAGFPGAPGMPPNGMMPGGVPPNMTPRQQNQMPPPPAPQPNAAGTQPSSPAPAAPPTPNQSAKSKAANKKDAKANKNSNKKNANAAAAAAAAAAATPASEAEQPPTPSPATPMTNAKSFQQNQAAVMAGMSAGAPNAGQGMQQGVMQPGQELGVQFNMDGAEQFNMINDFTMDNAHGDVLDNFDFDAFLQNTDQDGAIGSFDAFDFTTVGGVEAADGLGQ